MKEVYREIVKIKKHSYLVRYSDHPFARLETLIKLSIYDDEGGSVWLLAPEIIVHGRNIWIGDTLMVSHTADIGLEKLSGWNLLYEKERMGILKYKYVRPSEAFSPV